MSRRLVAIVIAVSSFAACDGDHQPAVATATSPTPTSAAPPTLNPAPPPSMVHGVVLDFQTATPIAGAVVGFATDFSPAGSRGMSETAVTDSNGHYSLAEPPARSGGQRYLFIVNNQSVGSGFPKAGNYRADVAVDRGLCIARYGMVLDSRTFAPIAGASARDLRNVVRATTGADGWYHIDWGCGYGYTGFNTTWHIMSHPDYNSSNFASGRGIEGVRREDVMLTPR